MQPVNDQHCAGPDLAELRAAAVLSQTDLAEKADLAQLTISQFETGKVASPRPASIRRLATALGLSPQEVAAAIAESRRRHTSIIAGDSGHA